MENENFMEALILQIKLSACSTNHYTDQKPNPAPLEGRREAFKSFLRDFLGVVGRSVEGMLYFVLSSSTEKFYYIGYC